MLILFAFPESRFANPWRPEVGAVHPRMCWSWDRPFPGSLDPSANPRFLGDSGAPRVFGLRDRPFPESLEPSSSAGTRSSVNRT
ncbi:hypothetical protein Nepgr_014527 [Nepenthes gracilis]|uniref:Uncharacterized protein n=1 Tax=Nepenthes gracilis TaxID=150966 RepID=A0AAD3SM04_NEPGR|nr:hypothetical protein Nepgr_014527 [Nepenthes gracilis]